MANIVNITDAEFDEKVVQGEGAIVVDFWAPWCGPCLRIAPILEELAEEMADRITVYKLNTDENQNTAIRYRVMSIPTLIVFKNGEEVERIIGAMPKEMLKAKLEAAIA
ncbi:MAG: thioredoxin [Limnochordales bacterium]|nr:MAG: thioredoxin [Bacillota bacterium]